MAAATVYLMYNKALIIIIIIWINIFYYIFKHCFEENAYIHWGFNFLMFKKLLCSPRLPLIDQKYSKNSNTLKYNYHLK